MPYRTVDPCKHKREEWGSTRCALCGENEFIPYLERAKIALSATVAGVLLAAIFISCATFFHNTVIPILIQGLTQDSRPAHTECVEPSR